MFQQDFLEKHRWLLGNDCEGNARQPTTVDLPYVNFWWQRNRLSLTKFVRCGTPDFFNSIIGIHYYYFHCFHRRCILDTIECSRGSRFGYTGCILRSVKVLNNDVHHFCRYPMRVGIGPKMRSYCRLSSPDVVPIGQDMSAWLGVNQRWWWPCIVSRLVTHSPKHSIPCFTRQWSWHLVEVASSAFFFWNR
jgi:hypothetical protein